MNDISLGLVGSRQDRPGSAHPFDRAAPRHLDRGELEPQRRRRGRAAIPHADRNAGRRREIDAVALCTPPQVRHARRAERSTRASMSCWRSRRARRVRRSSRWSRRPGGGRRHPVRDLAFALRRRPSRRRAAWPAMPGSRASRSSGRKTCATGIPARTGSGSPAGSASSIPASTRCRSSPRCCRGRCSSSGRRSCFPANRATPIAADLAFRDRRRRAGDRRLRLAADRAADLGHRGRDRQGAPRAPPAGEANSAIAGAAWR